MSLSLCLVCIVAHAGRTYAQDPQFVRIEVAPDGEFRLVVVPQPEDSGDYILESTTSLLEWTDTGVTGSTGEDGFEFLTPLTPGQSAEFFRVRYALGPGSLPWIRYIAPDWGGEGTPFTILGERFSPIPQENLVQFETLTETFPAIITSASEKVLTGVVPEGVNPPEGVRLHRVTVQVGERPSNGVGFEAQDFVPYLELKPPSCVLLLPPGTGKEQVVIGGGTPPYKLLPFDEYTQDSAQAVLNGNVVEVTATGEVNIDVQVQDSNEFPSTASATVYARIPYFAPELSVTYHSLLAGTSPGFTVDTDIWAQTMSIARVEFEIENVMTDFSSLSEGSILGLVHFGDHGILGGFQYLEATEVTDSSVEFRILALVEDELGDYFEDAAHGSVVKQPDSALISIETLGVEAEMVLPGLDHHLVFADRIFQLPATAGEEFSITANLYSVSVNKENDVPMEHQVVQSFTTVDSSGGPRLERVSPTTAEAGRYLQLFGSGFDSEPSGNTVTFAGPADSRIEAEVDSVEQDHLRVIVPKEAASGPLRVAVNGAESNDYLVSIWFRGSASVTFSEFNAGVPVSPVIFFDSPIKEDENSAETVYTDELGLDHFTVSLDDGSLNVASLTEGQVIGKYTLTNRTTFHVDDYEIFYDGLDPEDSERHIFSAGIRKGTKEQILATVYYGPIAEEPGVMFEIEPILNLKSGLLWTIEFDEAIYLPPPDPGIIVNTRCEVFSMPWNARPFTELVIINNGLLETR